MFRMIRNDDIPVCLEWYNWYIANSTATFETEPVTAAEYTERVNTVRQSYPWIILEDGEGPCGYAYLSAFNSREAYRHTADLAVYLDPEKRGKGYGSALMKEILRIAELDGYHVIISIVTLGNTESERLHEKHGFIKAASFPGVGYKHGQWLGVTFYVKNLRACTQEPEPVRNEDPYAEE